MVAFLAREAHQPIGQLLELPYHRVEQFCEAVIKQIKERPPPSCPFISRG